MQVLHHDYNIQPGSFSLFSTREIMTTYPQTLIQMSGAPGSGKSTLGTLLAHELNGTAIDHDILRSFFLDTGNSFSLAAKHAYKLQWVLAEDQLKKGWSVVMDSTCNYQETLDAGMELAERYGCTYHYVECQAHDLDLLDKRLQARQPLRSQRTSINEPPRDVNDDKKADPDKDHRASFEKWMKSPCRPAEDAIIVDSREEPAACLRNVLEKITGGSSAACGK